ncbi:MAG: DUF1850 domain-containing protein [Acidilobaceae archaeon]
MKILLPIIFFIIALVLLVPIVPILEVRVDSVQRLILLTPATIKLSYIHSVEKTTILEVLEAKRDCIVISKIKWAGYGAGMPSSILDINLEVRVDNTYYIAEVNKCLGNEVKISLGNMWNATLKINETNINGNFVELRLKRLSLAALTIKILGKIY